MKGHIRERSPGRWAIILDVPDPETGKRKRKWHSFSGGKREAQKECARLVAEMDAGSYVEPAKVTVSTFMDRWLEHMRSQVSPRTLERYEEIAKKNIVPLLGGTALTKLRPEVIAGAYAKALASGRRDGKGGLSPRTVHHMHRILKQALEHAVRWRILARNPGDAVDPPKVEHKKMSALDAGQTAKLLAHFRDTRMYVPVLLGVLCGLRRGEVTALKWSAVNLDGATLAVAESTEQTRKGIRQKETKTGRSRSVALPSLAVEELRRHRASQAEELLRLGVRLTDVPTSARGLTVYRSSRKASPTTSRGGWRAPKASRGFGFMICHSHATHLLLNGVHPKVAQERLGHSSVGITLDLYSHVLPGMQEDAAAKVDAAVRAALDKAAK